MSSITIATAWSSEPDWCSKNPYKTSSGSFKRDKMSCWDRQTSAVKSMIMAPMTGKISRGFLHTSNLFLGHHKKYKRKRKRVYLTLIRFRKRKLLTSRI
jgi:hypothetical protein